MSESWTFVPGFPPAIGFGEEWPLNDWAQAIAVDMAAEVEKQGGNVIDKRGVEVYSGVLDRVVRRAEVLFFLNGRPKHIGIDLDNGAEWTPEMISHALAK